MHKKSVRKWNPGVHVKPQKVSDENDDYCCMKIFDESKEFIRLYQKTGSTDFDQAQVIVYIDNAWRY